MSDHLTPEVITEGLKLDAARTPGEWEFDEERKAYRMRGLPAFERHATSHYAAALREVGGLLVAYNLMQKGMESQCELMDAMKQEVRNLRAAIKTHCQCRFENGKRVEECHWHACERHVQMENGDPSGVTLLEENAQLRAAALSDIGRLKDLAFLLADKLERCRYAALALVRELDREPPEPARVALTLDALRQLAVEKGDRP